MGTGSVIRIGIGQDAGDPTRYITSIGQSGLGLPNRDYYTREDAPFPELRTAYVDYIAASLERAGIDQPRERAEAIMALESQLAEIHWINNHAASLPAAFADARFDLIERRLRGVEEPRPHDRRAINLVSGRLGELVGQIYVERHFPPEYRAQMLKLAEYLRRAFRERPDVLDWMDDETRVEALAKLESFLPKIGYPDRWRDYSDISIQPDDLIGNSRRLGEWFWADSLARLNEPVREWEWLMSPRTVYAYYSSTRNEIVFPAAILQPPFFDPHADPAVNFGASGGVIGHEMGHGFDDQGSRSDSQGVLRNWWYATWTRGTTLSRSGQTKPSMCRLRSGSVSGKRLKVPAASSDDAAGTS